MSHGARRRTAAADRAGAEAVALQPAGLAGPMSQETNRPTVLYTPKSHVRASRALPITLHYNHPPIRSGGAANKASFRRGLLTSLLHPRPLLVPGRRGGPALGIGFFVRRTPVSNLAYLDRPGGLRNRVQHFPSSFSDFGCCMVHWCLANST